MISQELGNSEARMILATHRLHLCFLFPSEILVLICRVAKVQILGFELMQSSGLLKAKDWDQILKWFSFVPSPNTQSPVSFPISFSNQMQSPSWNKGISIKRVSQHAYPGEKQTFRYRRFVWKIPIGHAAYFSISHTWWTIYITTFSKCTFCCLA